MRIEAIWQELEAESEGGCPGGWLTRFALPNPSLPLLIAFETAAKRRALLLPLPQSVLPPRRNWPECRGLEVLSLTLNEQPHLCVRLRDVAFSDVFAALAEDVAPRVAASTSPREAADVLLGRLRRWQKFLAAGQDGLTLDQQRGLFGELHLLRGHLLEAFGLAAAVQGWVAPSGAHQDFQFAAAALEVKTTTAKQPQSVRITSERQLDTTGIAALFLHVVALDERDGDLAEGTLGESLPGLVAGIRQRLASETDTLEVFEDRLLDAGYLDAHGPRYEGRKFALRSETTFRIAPDFPRLIERGLPDGIGDVSYALSLSACRRFEVDTKEACQTVSQSQPSMKASR